LRSMWEQLRLLASFGTPDGSTQDEERKQLCKDLYAGDVRRLLNGFLKVYHKLSNSANKCMEGHLADMFRVHVLGKLDQPLLLPGSNSASVSIGQRPGFFTESQSGLGRPDWISTIPALGDNEPFVVIFEFKRVTSENDNHSNGSLKQARAGLEQITEIRYATAYEDYTRRLDIGIAIGLGKVAMRQRLWTKCGDAPAVALDHVQEYREYGQQNGETIGAWDERLARDDDDGWQDSLGWRTERIAPEFRQ
ncbi:hypothetical protein IWW38_003119, partial [Coemansia aciculifera]